MSQMVSSAEDFMSERSIDESKSSGLAFMIFEEVYTLVEYEKILQLISFKRYRERNGFNAIANPWSHIRDIDFDFYNALQNKKRNSSPAKRNFRGKIDGRTPTARIGKQNHTR